MQKTVLIILLALVALCGHSQEHTYNTLDELMGGITRGEQDAAVYLMGYKTEIENSDEWTDEIRFIYMTCVRGMVEYCSLQGWYIDQEQILTEAMRMFNERDGEPNNPYTRYLWCMKVRCEFERKDYDSALNYGHQALKMYEDSNDHGVEYCLLCANIAQSYWSKEDWLSAHLYGEEAYDTFRGLMRDCNISKTMGYFHIQNLRGLIFTSLQKYNQAIECFKEVVNEDNPTLPGSVYQLAINNLGTVYSKIGDHEKAMELLTSVGDINVASTTTLLQNLLIESFLSQNKTEAINYLRKYSEAWIRQTAAILGNFSEVERENYLKLQSRELVFINNLIAYSVPEIREDAFNANLYARFISMAIIKAIKEKQGTSSEYKKLAELRERLTMKGISPEEHDSIRRNILETERLLLKTDKSIYTQAESLCGNMVKVASRLNPNEAVVLYCYLPIWSGNDVDQHYAAFILNESDSIPQIVLLDNVDDIEDIYYNSSPDAEYVNSLYSKEKGKALYNGLWKPLEPYLQNMSTVYYSVVGPLSSLNFDAFISPEGRRLSEMYNTQLLSSPAILLDLSLQKSNYSDLVAFASPRFDMSTADMLQASHDYTNCNSEDISNHLALRGDLLRGNWQNLPGTRQEAEHIIELATTHGSTAKGYFDSEATEEAFKAISGKSPSILHVATHGFVISNLQQYDSSPFVQSVSGISPNNEYQLWAGLIFAGGNNTWRGDPIPANIEDGILTADEISRLDLSGTDLLVLSACETGRGHIDPIEGVWGLQRAFKLAGVKTILMTLWKIPDITTCMFMEVFYQNLYMGHSVRDSVKAAQCHLIENGATDPFYWAGFIVLD